MTFTNVNGLNPALFPASYDRGSVVTVQPVMRRKSLRRFSSLELPLSSARAIQFWHTLILAKPGNGMLRRHRAECRSMYPTGHSDRSLFVDSTASRITQLPRNTRTRQTTPRPEATRHSSCSFHVSRIAANWATRAHFSGQRQSGTSVIRLARSKKLDYAGSVVSGASPPRPPPVIPVSI